jgi:hypothetical protein
MATQKKSIIDTDSPMIRTAAEQIAEGDAMVGPA